jgi:hypothetical protein
LEYGLYVYNNLYHHYNHRNMNRSNALSALGRMGWSTHFLIYPISIAGYLFGYAPYSANKEK